MVLTLAQARAGYFGQTFWADIWGIYLEQTSWTSRPSPRAILHSMIQIHILQGSKEGSVLESDHPKFKIGDGVTVHVGVHSPELRDEQPVIKHRTTNYKVKNYSEQLQPDGSRLAQFEIRDTFTFD
jgi:hypothetical protein